MRAESLSSSTPRQNDPRPVLHALVGMGMLAIAFLLPLTAAYQLSSLLEPWIATGIEGLIPDGVLPAPLHHVVLGNYGLLSLGTMSLVWALPVVLLIGGSLNLLEQSGMQSWAVAALAPALRRVGLTPSDITPVLTGFGCNVIAVNQAQNCGQCRQSACLSMVTYSSTCSYQLGAAFAIFGIIGQPWLVAPYLSLLIIVGALHTRFWWGKAPVTSGPRIVGKLRMPDLARTLQAQAAGLRMFFQEAMPLFLLVCVLGAAVEYVHVPGYVGGLLAPVLGWLGIQEGLAPSVLFSLIRKDGILIANQGGGAVLEQLSAHQAFLFVYFASALSSCAVTLSAIVKGSNLRMAFTLWGRQVVTALVTTGLLHVVFRTLYA